MEDTSCRLEGWRLEAAAFAIAAALAGVAVIMHWQGSDLPAQLFRADLVRRSGFVLWSPAWFGGQSVLSYSVLSPVLGALVGPIAVGAISGVVSAILFARIARNAFGAHAWIGALLFAVGTVTNLIAGRTTFALGIAAALAAVYALQQHHVIVAVLAAAVSSLSSPVAGAFLVVAAAAWVCTDRTRRRAALAVLVAAAVPLAVIGLLFPTPGVEPFELWSVFANLALCAIVALAAREHKGLQVGAALFALAVVGTLVVPNALGGNINRMAQSSSSHCSRVCSFPRTNASSGC
jgi:hypothetical protein